MEAATAFPADPSHALILAAIPAGRSYAEALERAVAQKLHLWSARMDLDEDERIKALNDFCSRLCSGDEQAGRELATDAVWA